MKTEDLISARVPGRRRDYVTFTVEKDSTKYSAKVTGPDFDLYVESKSREKRDKFVARTKKAADGFFGGKLNWFVETCPVYDDNPFDY